MVKQIFSLSAVADAIRTSLGPKGMDKMIQSGNGDVTITNDGATILKQMKLLHPAARMVRFSTFIIVHFFCLTFSQIISFVSYSWWNYLKHRILKLEMVPHQQLLLLELFQMPVPDSSVEVSSADVILHEFSSLTYEAILTIRVKIPFRVHSMYQLPVARQSLHSNMVMFYRNSPNYNLRRLPGGC